MRRWEKEREVNWEHIFDALTNPKIDKDGELFIDITAEEMAAIDKLAEVCKGFRVNEDDHLPLSVRKQNDERFNAYSKRQFAYLKLVLA